MKKKTKTKSISPKSISSATVTDFGSQTRTAVAELKRLRTGIPRFDDILAGGLIVGSTYTLQGVPGTGKTIFANQVCFNHIRAHGGTCVYVTLLAESHAKMMMHLSTLSFFDVAAIPERMTYVSGYQSLKTQGPRGLIALARKSIKSLGATLLVIDGLQAIQQTCGNALEFDEFLHELQATTGMMGCTTLLLTVAQRGPTDQIVADGVIELTDSLDGARSVRELVVHKFRGSGFRSGRHDFEITANGMEVHPRIETDLLSRTSTEAPETGLPRLSFGVTGLDGMLGGGIRPGSSATLAGAPGSGKTLLGLSFLVEGAERGQPGIYFGFREPPARLVASAERVGIPLGKYVENGMIELFWEPTLERPLDSIAERICERVDARPTRRLFLDGVEAFCLAARYSNRIAPFLSALTSRLRNARVTTVFSEELDLFSRKTKPTIPALSAIVECVILLRTRPSTSSVRRRISILKMREARYDPAPRDFVIGTEGLRVQATVTLPRATAKGVRKDGPTESILLPSGGRR